MTAPVVVIPSKAKAWWALLIPLASSLIPLGMQLAGSLPAPYGAIFAGLLSLVGLVTGGAVHQAPYKPAGTVIVPEASLPSGGSGWPQP